MASVKKSVGTDVAKLPGVTAALGGAAGGILSRAVGIASESRNTGAYQASLSSGPTPGPKGVTDYAVSSDDPGALAIEYGHMTPASKKSPGVFVPGKHILGRAAGVIQ